VADTLLYSLTVPATDSLYVNSPQLKLQQATVDQSRAAYRLEANKLLPSITLGYANMSLRGWQTSPGKTEVFYNPADRFQSVSLGIGIPLFFGGHTSRIKAAKTEIRVQQKERENTKLRLQTELDNAWAAYRRNQELLSDYRQSLIPNAVAIIQTATNRLEAGEINYLDWVILVNQSLDIRSQYIQTILQQNEASFEIERLQGINL
jgi:cobalt-zinc-cadmium resistance protein CzcA